MNKYGSLLIIIGGCMWGTMGIFARAFTAAGFSSSSVVTVRSIIAAVVLSLVLLVYNKELFKIKIKDLWCFIGTGVIGIFMFNCAYFATIEITSLSVATILLYTSAIFVMLISVPCFKEKITKKKLVCLVIAILGVVFVSGIVTGGTGALSAAGLLVGLASGLGYGLYTIFSRFAMNRGYDSFTIMFYTYVCAVIAGFFFTDFEEVGQVISSEGISIVVLLVVNVLVTIVIPYALYLTGLKTVENGKAAILAFTEPITSIIVGMVVFNEIPDVWGFLGIALVLTSLTMLNLKSKTEN